MDEVARWAARAGPLGRRRPGAWAGVAARLAAAGILVALALLGPGARAVEPAAEPPVWNPSGLFGGSRLHGRSSLPRGTLLSILGPASGGALLNLRAYQIAFAGSPDGNTVFLLWDDTDTRPHKVQVFEDDGGPGPDTRFVHLGDVTSRKDNGGAVITWVKPGVRRYKVVDGSSENTTEILVLNVEPTAGAAEITCAVGAASEGAGMDDGCGCSLTVSWTSDDPPDEWIVTADRDTVFHIDGAAGEVRLEGLCPGYHRVEVRAFHQERYLGSPSTVCCAIDEGCVRAPPSCPPVSGIRILQDRYGDPGSRLRVDWEENVAFDSIDLRIDPGRPTIQLDGWWRGITIADLPPGPHTFTFQPTCCDVPGPSASVVFDVLLETPYPAPFDGMQSRWLPKEQTIEASWAGGGGWERIHAFVVRDAGSSWSYGASLPGGATSWLHHDAAAGEHIGLQAFDADGHGSARVLCAPLFRRGDSDGSSQLDITDAIGTLGFLFRGTETVLCNAAADANADGRLDIADSIFTLGFLFHGTAPPPLPGPHACGPDPAHGAMLGCDLARCP